VTITTAEEARAALLGAWRLLSLQRVLPDGTVEYPLGPDAIGQLVYTESGRMSAQLVRPGQPPFTSEDTRAATDEEIVTAWHNYAGYYGTYRIDVDAQAVIHEIQASWMPNLAGTEGVRRYRIDGDLLHLEADGPQGTSRVTWQKVRPQ
jgi:hypothetical protein